MRLTRRITLPTGLEICLSARPLPRDGAAAAGDRQEKDTQETQAGLPPVDAASPPIS